MESRVPRHERVGYSSTTDQPEDADNDEADLQERCVRSVGNRIERQGARQE